MTRSTATTPDVRGWFHSLGPADGAELRLYCFPFAGGSELAFLPWARLLPAGVALHAARLPGRLDRLDAEPYRDLGTLATALAGAVGEHAGDERFVLFGHSMGALLAFEVARELRRRGGPAPVLLGVSGLAAPQLREARPPAPPLSDRELIERVSQLGGMPPELLHNPTFRELVVPSLRADLTSFENYRYADEPPLAGPISVFGGDADPLVPVPELGPWRAQTRARCAVRVFGGDHFFLARHPAALLAALLSDAGGPRP
jgi:surfactin synthase thioesterase subunit